ncbi:MAG TPA: glycosyltransferase family 4 protein [Candidatus Bathyarchaeia archaeon]|nr:glycosyltransferase family 4 protein [Candidatus Bathyarchaeia archaeon]
MSKLRVLLAGHLPPPMGGIGTFCQDLLASDLARETELRFVQTSSQRRDLLASGIATWGNLLEAVKDGRRYWRVFREHPPDVVHICTAQGLSLVKNSLYVLVTRAAGCPVLLHPHCSLAKLYGRRPPWRLFCRGVFRLAGGVLGLSREWLSLRRIMPGLTVEYLPNAIDTRPYLEIAARRPAVPGGGPVHLLYLGYLGEEKGTFDLLEAFRVLDPGRAGLVLHLVGDFLSEPDRIRLESAVREVEGPGKTCRLEPPVSGEKKRAAFELADIFVFPSHDEGMPMAILEAMASGLPVAATSVGGIPDLIREGTNGFLTASGDPASLAGSLAGLIADGDLCRRLGSQGAADARAHDINGYAQTLREIYGILAPHHHRSLRGGGAPEKGLRGPQNG